MLMKHWIGEGIPENVFDLKNTLTTGQTFLAFVLLSGLYCLCLTIFLVEVIFSKTTKREPNVQKVPLTDSNIKQEVEESDLKKPEITDLETPEIKEAPRSEITEIIELN